MSRQPNCCSLVDTSILLSLVVVLVVSNLGETKLWIYLVSFSKPWLVLEILPEIWLFRKHFGENCFTCYFYNVWCILCTSRDDDTLGSNTNIFSMGQEGQDNLQCYGSSWCALLFLLDFSVEHWFGCRTTVPGFAGDIGAIEHLLIDWLISP